MNFSSKILIIKFAVLLWLLPLNTFAKAPIKVHVSVLPQKYFVERIGSHRVNVNVLVKPGKSPSTYAPSPAQIEKLVVSDVYFRIGVPFENGILQKIKAIATARIVDTRQEIELRQMKETYSAHKVPKPVETAQGNETHPVNDADHHPHIGQDPHIWMNPALVKTQARTIFLTLSDLDPDGKDEYKINYDLFVKDLNDLDDRLKTALKDLKGESLFVFHPSFGYFTDAYGLNQIAVETMGKAPKGKALSKIIKRAKKQSVRVIFVQPQFDRNAAEKIASAINGVVIPINPLAYDYLANMENISQTIAKTLKE